MKYLRKLLSCLLLLSLCLGLIACSSKPYEKDAYQDLRDYIRDKRGVGSGLTLLVENNDTQVYFYLRAPKTEEEKKQVDKEPLYLSMIQSAEDDRYTYSIDLVLNPDDFHNMYWRWRYCDRELHAELLIVETTLDPATYTGKELMSFENMTVNEPEETGSESETVSESETSAETSSDTDQSLETLEGESAENYLRELATEMTNFSLRTMDEYCLRVLGYDLSDYGFAALADEYRFDPNAPVTLPSPSADIGDILTPNMMTLSTGTIIPLSAVDADEASADETSATTDTVVGAETEEDLGPAFSSERWSYAGRMTLLGMGMVFAVLGFLWAVISIFKMVVGNKSPKPKKEEKPETPAPVAAPAPVSDDPAVVAAITAAIAAMIESDPALSTQFADGFRVVSFKRRSGKTSWNH